MIVSEYFKLTDRQAEQFAQLDALYRDWNSKINVISRKDIDNLYEHHVLHSLAIAKWIPFQPDTTILDVGTGGGFPGIPLAIMSLGLTNVVCKQERVEEEKEKFDFVVSRAVMPLPDLVKLVRKNISNKHRNAIPNGLIVLKGGDLQAEVAPYIKTAEIAPCSKWFKGEWFETKQIIYLPF